MNFSIRHIKEHDVIRIDFFGTVRGLNEIDTIMKKLRLTADYYSCLRILCDVRDAYVADRFTDMYHLGIKIAANGSTRDYCTAVLFAGDEKKHRIVEKVLRNRDYQIMLFRDENEALQWMN